MGKVGYYLCTKFQPMFMEKYLFFSQALDTSCMSAERRDSRPTIEQLMPTWFCFWSTNFAPSPNNYKIRFDSTTECRWDAYVPFVKATVRGSLNVSVWKIGEMRFFYIFSFSLPFNLQNSISLKKNALAITC